MNSTPSLPSTLATITAEQIEAITLTLTSVLSDEDLLRANTELVEKWKAAVERERKLTPIYTLVADALRRTFDTIHVTISEDEISRIAVGMTYDYLQKVDTPTIKSPQFGTHAAHTTDN